MKFFTKKVRSVNLRKNLMKIDKSNMVNNVNEILSDKSKQRVKVVKSDNSLFQPTTESITVVNEEGKELLKD